MTTREKVNTIAGTIFFLSLLLLAWGFSILSANLVFFGFLLMAISLVTCILSAPEWEKSIFSDDDDYVPPAPWLFLWTLQFTPQRLNLLSNSSFRRRWSSAVSIFTSFFSPLVFHPFPRLCPTAGVTLYRGNAFLDMRLYRNGHKGANQDVQ